MVRRRLNLDFGPGREGHYSWAESENGYIHLSSCSLLWRFLVVRAGATKKIVILPLNPTIQISKAFDLQTFLCVNGPRHGVCVCLYLFLLSNSCYLNIIAFSITKILHFVQQFIHIPNYWLTTINILLKCSNIFVGGCSTDSQSIISKHHIDSRWPSTFTYYFLDFASSRNCFFRFLFPNAMLIFKSCVNCLVMYAQ